MRDPGEGSIEINYDDEKTSHDRLFLKSPKVGEVLEWHVGSGHSNDAPTYEAVGGIDLPETRSWNSISRHTSTQQHQMMLKWIL